MNKKKKTNLKSRHGIYFLIIAFLLKIFLGNSQNDEYITSIGGAAILTYFIVLLEKIFTKGLGKGVDDWITEMDSTLTNLDKSDPNAIKYAIYLILLFLVVMTIVGIYYNTDLYYVFN